MADSKPGRRVGLFGGSFDPPHLAHLALARTARSALQLQELLWLPVGQAWHKSRPLTPAVHREAMVRAAIADEPGFVLERMELQRSGPSYTVDTVEALQARAIEPVEPANWFLIIGGDQLAALHTWHRWSQLLQRVTLAVAFRPGFDTPLHPDVQQAARVTLPFPAMDCSSTEIRRRVAQGESIAEMVPPPVARYIDQHHLYRKDAASAH